MKLSKWFKNVKEDISAKRARSNCLEFAVSACDELSVLISDLSENDTRDNTEIEASLSCTLSEFKERFNVDHAETCYPVLFEISEKLDGLISGQSKAGGIEDDAHLARARAALTSSMVISGMGKTDPKWL